MKGESWLTSAKYYISKIMLFFLDRNFLHGRLSSSKLLAGRRAVGNSVSLHLSNLSPVVYMKYSILRCSPLVSIFKDQSLRWRLNIIELADAVPSRYERKNKSKDKKRMKGKTRQKKIIESRKNNELLVFPRYISRSIIVREDVYKSRITIGAHCQVIMHRATGPRIPHRSLRRRPMGM